MKKINGYLNLDISLNQLILNKGDFIHRLTHLEKYRRYQKKHFVNVWTIENEEALKVVDHKVDTITFQHLDLDKIKNALN